jgi:hypothetical protein
MTDPFGVTRTTTTSAFGLYSFDGIQNGGEYILRVTSKRYRFSAQTVPLNASVSDINFGGLE